MRHPAYIEVCQVVSADYVNGFVTVTTPEGIQKQFPLVYSGVVSDISDYTEMMAFVIYNDIYNDNGIAFLISSGLSNPQTAQNNSQKPNMMLL